MADTKASDFATKLTINDDDLVLIVDDPAGTPIQKVISFANCIAGLQPNPATAALDMDGNQIIGAPATQTLAAELVSKAHLDTTVGSFITSTLAADLDLNGNQASGAPAAQTLDDHLISKKHFEDNTVELPTLTALQAWRKNAGNTAIEPYTPYVPAVSATEGTLPFVITGGGTTMPTGLVEGAIQVPWMCTIDAVAVLLDASATIAIDVWKTDQSGAPPTVLDSIVASAPVSTTAAIKSRDTSLTGWLTSLSKGDWIMFSIQSNDVAKWAAISLEITKT